MTAFWWSAALMAAVAAAIVLAPGRRRARGERLQREAASVALYRARLNEIEDERGRGLLTDDAAAAMRDELDAALLAETPLADTAAAGSRLDAGGDVASAPASGRNVVALALAVLIPLAGGLWYAEVGALDRLETAAVARAVDAAATGGHADGDLPALVRKLEQRLEQTPEDADGWFLLGRSALDSGDAELAARAFERVVTLIPEAAAAAAYLAQARFMRDGNRVTPEVRQSIDAVLRLIPDQPIMMEMLAVDAFQRGDYAQTERLLERGLAGGPAPERRAFFEAGLARARELQGLPATGTSASAAIGVAPPAADASRPDAAGSAAGRAVIVDVQGAIGSAAPADRSTVFIVARAVGGPPMPLAVVRRPAADLPFTVTLDRSTAMNPALTLDTASAVEVYARVSRIGSADRAADDIESAHVPVTLGGEPARVSLTLGATGAAAAPVSPSVPAIARAEPPGRTVRALIELAPGYEPPDAATVFVFAREREGPPMPVAVTRVAVSALPMIVTLDDSMAMTPQRTLASVAGALEVVARVSMHGGATPASGDLEGRAPVLPDGRVVSVLIDRRLP